MEPSQAERFARAKATLDRFLHFCSSHGVCDQLEVECYDAYPAGRFTYFLFEHGALSKTTVYRQTPPLRCLVHLVVKQQLAPAVASGLMGLAAELQWAGVEHDVQVHAEHFEFRVQSGPAPEA